MVAILLYVSGNAPVSNEYDQGVYYTLCAMILLVASTMTFDLGKVHLGDIAKQPRVAFSGATALWLRFCCTYLAMLRFLMSMIRAFIIDFVR